MKRRLVPSDHIKKLPRFFAYVAIARHDRTMIRVKERHAVERVPAFIPRVKQSEPEQQNLILLTPPHRKYVKIHTGMKWRCKYHPDYAGRGIAYPLNWEKYEDFEQEIEAHLGPRPSEDHTLDRIDNDGPYRLGNVRWATKKDQAINRRKRRVRALAASDRSRSP